MHTHFLFFLLFLLFCFLLFCFFGLGPAQPTWAGLDPASPVTGPSQWLVGNYFTFAQQMKLNLQSGEKEELTRFCRDFARMDGRNSSLQASFLLLALSFSVVLFLFPLLCFVLSALLTLSLSLSVHSLLFPLVLYFFSTSVFVHLSFSLCSSIQREKGVVHPGTRLALMC